ncbi:MAG TPA: FtsX-like permease family protein, partial [Burkholderiaceae bacterium]|nr:FtsX-like permease family protein [Burkholderiaceae bacterium]
NPLLPFDINNALFIPIKADRRLVNSTGYISNIAIRAREHHDPIQALSDVSNHFRQIKSSAQVMGALQLIDNMKQQGQLFKWLLGGIAAISLLVGGIGIMNAMLADISDRKTGIGLRIAIGADRFSIMAMIVTESTLLAFIGGGAGVLLGLGISTAFAWFSGWTPQIFVPAACLGFGMSVVTGLFFGIYPALRASALSPIETLRSE